MVGISVRLQLSATFASTLWKQDSEGSWHTAIALTLCIGSALSMSRGLLFVMLQRHEELEQFSVLVGVLEGDFSWRIKPVRVQEGEAGQMRSS